MRGAGSAIEGDDAGAITEPDPDYVLRREFSEAIRLLPK